MSAARIKNLILLILALAVCFLLIAVAPGRLAARRTEAAVTQELTELFAGYGVTLEAELPRSEALCIIELDDGSVQAAQALLGQEAQEDAASTRYETRFFSEYGTAVFQRSGAVEAALDVPVQGGYEKDMKRRLRTMGCTLWQIQPAVRGEDGSYRLTAQQALLGVPVFGAELTFTYQDGTLCAVSGTVCPGNGTAQRVSEQECMSCADALTQILASRDETGWVGSRILSVQQGYLHAETAAAALRFVPMWQIETDTALFFINGITGEVRQSAA